MNTKANNPLQIVEGKEVKRYSINEVFYSLQGEGVRAGTANVFVRFQGCNLRCSKDATEPNQQFDCDTEFMSGRRLTLDEIAQWVLHSQRKQLQGQDVACDWLILTGGEPALQVDKEFCDYFHQKGYKLAIETNGTIEVPRGNRGSGDPGGPTNDEKCLLDWVCVSPKVAEHCIRQKTANEVKYVRHYGQGIPKTVVEADHYLISPAFEGNLLDKETLEWCMQLVRENPKWRLSVQQHKTTMGGIR